MTNDSSKGSEVQFYESPHGKMAYRALGQKPAAQSAPTIIWAHGWGQDHTAMFPLAESLIHLGRHFLIDTPGFGQSPVPFETIDQSWSSRQYADFMAGFIRTISPKAPIIWIGHSFGCRIALQLGAHHPDLIDRMILIAGAGLKRKRTPLQTLMLQTKIRIYKAGKILKPFLKNKQFGSKDYKAAGPMRGTLVKVVNEDLTAEAAKITCPALLIYGENDTETPSEIGYRLHKLIKTSEMIPLSDQDHYTVLSEGRHTVAAKIKTFIKT